MRSQAFPFTPKPSAPRVRMTTDPFRQEQFLDVIDRDEAERRFRDALDLRPLEAETVPLAAALGRVLADDVIAPLDVPGVRPLQRRRLRRAGRGHVRGRRGPAPSRSASTPRCSPPASSPRGRCAPGTATADRHRGRCSRAGPTRS